MTKNISSKNIAKSRLINVLYNDRTRDMIDNSFMDLMKHDISKAISKYIAINENNIELTFTPIKENINSPSAILNARIYIDNFLGCLRKESYDKEKTKGA